MGCGCGKKKEVKPPEWLSEDPVAIGCDREAFLGIFTKRRRKKKPCRIYAAKKHGDERIRHEIKVMTELGKLPEIMRLYYASTSGARTFMALEDHSFELAALVNCYMFAVQTIPSSFARSILKNLCDAVEHMHGHGLIHRDIKMESVMLTNKHKGKLTDMGLTCPIGRKESRWIHSNKTHIAWEVCQGDKAQGKEVDCWGLGIVLHQLYQFRWDILDASKKVVMPRPDRPSTSSPMDEHLLQVMLALLACDPERRMHTAQVKERVPPDNLPNISHDWKMPAEMQPESRKLLCRYKHSGSPMTAYAAHVPPRHKDLVGKCVGEIFPPEEDPGAVLLLVDTPEDEDIGRERTLVKNPGRRTVVEGDSWLYFGVDPEGQTEDIIDYLERRMFPELEKEVKRGVGVFIRPMALGLEFDCFRFPEHTPMKSIIGQADREQSNAFQLNLRSNFGLNLAGIVKKDGGEPLWFPGPRAVVGPGDLGLIVRVPDRQDGITAPGVTDEMLDALMDKRTFQRILREQYTPAAISYTDM